MISQTVEYALRAMTLLAQNVDFPVTIQTIAARGQIPAPYLSKLLQGLTRAGLVKAQRGVGGGYILTRKPNEISLADVINVMEPLQRITKCPLGITGHIALCPLHSKLDQALAAVEKAFQETSLADLCTTQGSIPLCSSNAVVTLELGTAGTAKETAS
jgi:Rrf2 family transcriptional regulator, nitric oxide-sensitive transcriptional repressor